MANVFRNLPSINELLETPQIKRLMESASRNTVIHGVRDFLDGLRGDIQTAAADTAPAVSDLAERIVKWISREPGLALQPVINATGVLLHPALGRAPLAAEAVAAAQTLAAGYCSLDADAESGAAAQRHSAVEPLLLRLSGAEAAAVVNNNAGGTLLTLAALAAGREVLVSRGQLLDAGGYRLPELVATSGARLREVGATNRTRIDDFRDALSTESAAMLRVQTSEFKMTGLCEQPALGEMVTLSRRRNVPLIDILGSGGLVDLAHYGVLDEPVVGASVRAGADLVLCSGDKLLGGPQCGLIFGRRVLVERLLAHPLARVLRVGKLTLATLAATLQLYDEPAKLDQRLPLLQMLSTSVANLRHRAERLAPQLAALSAVGAATVEDGESHLHGVGDTPIPSCCVAVTPAQRDADQLAQALRRQTPAIWARVRHGRVWLDLRTVTPDQDESLVAAFQSIGAS